MPKHSNSIPARGLNEKQVAGYWGVSVGTLRKMISLGHVPPALDLPGIDRKIFDRDAQERAMTARNQAAE